ncbi:MAG: peptidylprolyl isomerase [Patescibacteria group bacterium]
MNKYISILVIVLVIVAGFIILKYGKSNNVEPIPIVEENLPVQDEVKTVEENVPKNEEKVINNLDNKKMTSAILHTSEGDVTLEFYASDAPNTVANFQKLAESGFYNGVKFHRVIKGFMIQGGDPVSKDDSKANYWGTGGPGYKFEDEIKADSVLYKTGYKKGVLAMANSGPNTNGSQFFIMHADYPLPPLYTIFGKVKSGQDVVDKIALVEVGPNDRPVEAVIIKSIEVK